MPLQLDHVDTVVLAGGSNTVPLFAGHTPGYKALLEFQGKPAINYTLAALRATPQVGRICIAGPEQALRTAVDGEEAYTFVPGGETLMDSIYSGLSHFADSPMVLLATADIPLLTPRSVDDFLRACETVETTYEQNLYLPLVPQRSYTGAYTECLKGCNRFRDVAACHGCLMLVDPRLLQNTKATRRINSLYNNRKSPVSSALAIGMPVGLSFVLGVHLWHLLSIEQMASIASKRFGIGLIPILSDHPEISIDVDEPEDYAFVQRQLAAKAAQAN